MKIERKAAAFVTLETADGGRRKEFEVEHAERVLRRPKGGGWKLPDDSPYQFDYYDGITKRTSQGDSKETT